MSQPGRKRWRYHAGEKFKNRVTARECDGTIRLTWWERGKPASCPTGTHSIQRAIVMAEAKADELLRARTPARKTHERDEMLVAIRQDLLRVAAEAALPAGYAPSIVLYRKVGRFGINRVRAAFRGYVRCNGRGTKAADEWKVVVRRFGLRPWLDRYLSTERGVLADVREVALKCGHPGIMPSLSEYQAHGKWSWTAARKRLGGICWPELADMAGLAIAPERRAHSHKVRNRPPHASEIRPRSEAAA